MLFGEGGGETSGSYGGRVKMFLASIGGGATPPLRSPGFSPANIAAAPAANDVRQLVPVPSSYSARPAAAAPPADEVAYLPVDPMTGASGSAASSAYSQPPPPPKPATVAPLAAMAAPSQPSGTIASAAHDANGRSEVQQSGWEEFAGHSGGEQLKTVLAGLGVLLLLWQVILRDRVRLPTGVCHWLCQCGRDSHSNGGPHWQSQWHTRAARQSAGASPAARFAELRRPRR